MAVSTFRLQNFHFRPTVITLSLDPFDIVHLGVVFPEELVGLGDTFWTENALFVGRVVLELRATSLARGLFFPTLPVTLFVPSFGSHSSQ